MKRSLLLALVLFFAASANAEELTVFREAQRHGDETPSSNLYWSFDWNGKSSRISSDGSGNVAGKAFQMPLNSTRLTRNVHFADYKGDLLLLVEETDEESAGGKIARLNGKTLKPRWTQIIPSFNIGPGLIEDKAAYFSACGTAMKVNLENGQWVWKKSNLQNTNESTRARFNAFGAPVIKGEEIAFPEMTSTGSGNSTSPGVTFSKFNGDIVEIR